MDTIIRPSDKPIVPVLKHLEITIQSSDPAVRPLIALIGTTPERYILTRFTPTDEQRLALSKNGDLFLCIQTHSQPLQPILLFVSEEELDPANVVEYLQLVPFSP